jgi:tetratricopeptide (TPR) repeat protein
MKSINIFDSIQKLNKITRDDGHKKYAQTQLTLGSVYMINKLYKKAEKYFEKISREDCPTMFAIAQLFLGQIYESKNHGLNHAIIFYSKITREDDSRSYAKAQFNLGSIYLHKKKDIGEAIKYFSNIYEEDDSYHYIYAQLKLGSIFQYNKKEIDKAIEYYSKIPKNVSLEIYNIAQFQLADIYCFQKNCIIDSIGYYQNIVYSSHQPYLYISAKIILELIDNEFFGTNKNYLKKLIVNNAKTICKLVSNIKYELLISLNEEGSERRVAHYTKPAVLFNLLKGKNLSKFRLNIVDFMNDPSENQVLTNWLNITNNPDNEIKSFLASFSFNHNSLNQFRLYGNEDNILGSGVSIAFNQNFFGLDTKRSISNEIALAGSIKSVLSVDNKQIKFETEQTEIKSNDTLYPLPLYRCLYFDPKTEYMSLAKRNKQSFYLEMCDEKKETADIDDEWERYIDALKEEGKIQIIRKQLKKIKELMRKLLNNKGLKKIPNLEQLLSLALLPISCLIKHAAFEDEDECRMIYITHIADDKIVEPQDYQSANSLYVEYTNVENHIDIIYLGPQCKLPHKLWLQNHFKKKLQGKQIKLIKSEMPLR